MSTQNNDPKISRTETDSGRTNIETDTEINVAGKEPSAVAALPPEEGIKGWLCVFGSFLTLFCTFGFLNAVGVFQSYYESHYLESYTPSDISWIFSFQLMSMWAPGPFIGRLVDTYGPGPVLYPGAALCIFALCMTSLATKYYQIFLAQGVGFGLGAGMVFTSSFICVGQWFVKRRGLAIGIASMGSSLGGVIFPLFFNQVIDEVGFAGAMRYAALFVGVLLAIGCYFVRSRLPRRDWDPKAKFVDVRLFKDPMFTLFAFGSFLVMWGLWIPFDFISTFAKSQGFSSELSVALISIINATSIPGRILPPYLSDSIGHFNVILVSEILIGISILALWLPFDFVLSHAGVIVFCLIYGFVSGAFVSLLMPCVAKTGSIETIGLRFGNAQMVLAVACLTGLPISGAVMTHQGGSTYWGGQTFAVTSALLGSLLTACSTGLLRRKQGAWRV